MTHSHTKTTATMADSSPSAASIPMAALDETQISPAKNSSSTTAQLRIHSVVFCCFPQRIATLVARTTHRHETTQKRSRNNDRFVDTAHQPSTIETI